jgi:hypothetical protein
LCWKKRFVAAGLRSSAYDGGTVAPFFCCQASVKA